MGLLTTLQNLLVRKLDPAAAAQYGTCVATARQPVFYAALGVPDTLDGRFDLLLLHVLLVIVRLQDAAAQQRLFDLMFADMERSLREMGVGDMSIGKKMKPMLAGFYGRAGAYEKALAAAGNEELTRVLSRNLYGRPDGSAEHAAAIADYIRDCVAHLARQTDDALAAGRIAFPPVVA